MLVAWDLGQVLLFAVLGLVLLRHVPGRLQLESSLNEFVIIDQFFILNIEL